MSVSVSVSVSANEGTVGESSHTSMGRGEI